MRPSQKYLASFTKVSLYSKPIGMPNTQFFILSKKMSNTPQQLLWKTTVGEVLSSESIRTHENLRLRCEKCLEVQGHQLSIF